MQSRPSLQRQQLRLPRTRTRTKIRRQGSATGRRTVSRANRGTLKIKRISLTPSGKGWKQSGVRPNRTLHQYPRNTTPNSSHHHHPHLPSGQILQNNHHKNRRDRPIRPNREPPTDRLLGHLGPRSNHCPQHTGRTHTTTPRATLPRRPHNDNGLQTHSHRHGSLTVRLNLPALQGRRMDRSPRQLRKSNREKPDTDKNPHTRQRNSHHPELHTTEKVRHQPHPIRSPPHPDTSRSQHRDRPGED